MRLVSDKAQTPYVHLLDDPHPLEVGAISSCRLSEHRSRKLPAASSNLSPAEDERVDGLASMITYMKHKRGAMTFLLYGSNTGRRRMFLDVYLSWLGCTAGSETAVFTSSAGRTRCTASRGSQRASSNEGRVATPGKGCALGARKGGCKRLVQGVLGIERGAWAGSVAWKPYTACVRLDVGLLEWKLAHALVDGLAH